MGEVTEEQEDDLIWGWKKDGLAKLGSALGQEAGTEASTLFGRIT